MKTISIQVSDKQHSLLSRIAAAEKRRLSDFNYLIFGQGLDMFFCERSVHVKKEPDEYTKEEKKQLAVNKKVEKSKSIERSDWDEHGWEHVSNYMYNYDKPDGQMDFVTRLAHEIEDLAYKVPCMTSKEAA
tara:strand:- start:48 stop:440 length:393 start_codon:yes stop_codon:yes gene_type:complete